jgi:hypothetical protein
MSKNLISHLLYFLVISFYVLIQDYPLLFMWLAFMVGYTKNIWDYLNKP